MQLRLAVDVTQHAARLRTTGAANGIDPYAAQQRQVDHQTAVAHRQAGDVVAASPDGIHQAVFARELHGSHDIGGADAACDQRRSAIDHRIPDLARFVVERVVRLQQLAAEVGLESLQRVGRNLDARAVKVPYAKGHARLRKPQREPLHAPCDGKAGQQSMRKSCARGNERASAESEAFGTSP